MVRAQTRVDVRRLDALVRDVRIQAALHQHRVGGGIGSEEVKARLAVEIAFRRIDLAGELVVEKTAAVIQPVGIGGLGVEDALGEVAAIGDAQHMQDRVLTAVLRQPVDHVRAARRGLPPVERLMAARVAEQRRVDEHTIDTLLAHEQLVVVGARRPLLEEQPPSGAAHAARHRGVAGELPDALQQPLAAGNAIEHRARMRVLTLQERQPVRVLIVLHPAVGIAEGFAEVGVPDDFDPRHRRRRDARGGSCAHPPCQEGHERAARPDEPFATIDCTHTAPVSASTQRVLAPQGAARAPLNAAATPSGCPVASRRRQR